MTCLVRNFILFSKGFFFNKLSTFDTNSGDNSFALSLSKNLGLNPYLNNVLNNPTYTVIGVGLVSEGVCGGGQNGRITIGGIVVSDGSRLLSHSNQSFR